ncbi:MAG: ribonuclease Z [Candidatus Eisenbacteria bacterium]
MIHWTVIGSGTHMASGRRGSPGHLAAAGATRLLVDCGAGTFHGLARAGVCPESIDGCLVTHLHPDHVADLVPFLFRVRNHVKERGEGRRLVIAGPGGIGSFFRELRALHAPFLETPNLEISVREVESDNFEIGDIEVRSIPVPHGIDSVAYSCAAPDGSRIVYTGDTGRSAELIRLARGAAILVIEASLPVGGEPAPFHLSAPEAASVAAAVEVKAMVLVHLNPESDGVDLVAECGDLFSGKILVGEDGLTVRVEGGEPIV